MLRRAQTRNGLPERLNWYQLGAVYAQLDQHFVIDLSEGAAQITVTSAGRGGAQAFPARIDRECDNGGLCARLIASQRICQD